MTTPLRRIDGWAVASGVGAAAAIAGAFMPLLAVDGRRLSGSTVLVGNAVAWSISDRTTITLLLERRDLAVLVMVVVLVMAALCATRRSTRWAAAVGVLGSTAGFHMLLSMVQRAENFAVPSQQEVSYSLGAMLCLTGPLWALVGFLAVLARRH